jgi:hypothetical protein
VAKNTGTLETCRHKRTHYRTECVLADASRSG